MTRYLTICIVIIGSLACLACAGEDNFELDFVVVQTPGSSSPYCKNTAGSNTALKSAEYTLRLTFMQRAQGPIPAARVLHDYTVICDRLVNPGEETKLQVSLTSGNKFSLRVEAFTKKKALAFVGQTEDLDLSTERAVVYLRAVGKVSCVDPARYPRAFHSATLLPNGEVLLMGGLVSDATQGKLLHVDATDTRDAYATGSVEVFDPKTMSFKQAGSIPARAFHQAHLLPSKINGVYEVLVVGGVKSSATPPGPAFNLRAADYDYSFLVSPHQKSEAAEALLVSYDPSSGQVTNKVLSSLPRLMMPQSVELPASRQAVFAGGGAGYTVSGKTKSFTAGKAFWVELKDLDSRGGDPKLVSQTTLKRIRAGNALAPLGPSRFFIYGGNMLGKSADCTSATDTNCNKHVAEWLNQSSGTPDTTLISFASPYPQTKAWHTLTTIGLQDDQLAPEPGTPAKTPTMALLAGGYPLVLDTERNMQLAWDWKPPTKNLQLVRDGNVPTFHDVSTTGDGHFLPAEYHAAVRLSDGSVMLSGGNASSSFSWAKQEACEKTSSPFCAYRQISIYGLKGGAVELSGHGSMTVGRFGHRTTRLLDNTVLITGGVSLIGSKPQLLQHAEIYNPRTGHASEDPFGRGPVMDYDTAKKRSGHQCLTQEE